MTLPPVLSAIRRRRSVREFIGEPVSQEDVVEILTAGIWAPSGLNNQPWRFVVVRGEDVRRRLAGLTHYGHIVTAAPLLIVVFLDTEAMYDTVKDHQAVGACIQNMLLAADALGLGAVWLGQIVKNKTRVNQTLGLDERYDLMAVLAIGRPAHRDQKSHRKELDHFLLKEL